jgi:hypothetical protein
MKETIRRNITEMRYVSNWNIRYLPFLFHNFDDPNPLLSSAVKFLQEKKYFMEPETGNNMMKLKEEHLHQFIKGLDEQIPFTDPNERCYRGFKEALSIVAVTLLRKQESEKAGIEVKWSTRSTRSTRSVKLKNKVVDIHPKDVALFCVLIKNELSKKDHQDKKCKGTLKPKWWTDEAIEHYNVYLKHYVKVKEELVDDDFFFPVTCMVEDLDEDDYMDAPESEEEEFHD